MIQQIAAQNPDQQAQQMLQWFATPDGLITFTIMFLLTILVFFLIIGMSSWGPGRFPGESQKSPSTMTVGATAPPSDIMR